MRNILLIAMLFFVTQQLHKQLIQYVHAESTSHEILPDPATAITLAMGYRPLVADYYWLRTLSEFGDLAWQKKGSPRVVPLLKLTLALDPQFEIGYEFAATALTVDGMDPQIAHDIASPGIALFPDNWRIPFYISFIAMHYLDDNPRAAQTMAIAATRPEAPSYTRMLATQLAARGGVPEIGLAMLQAIFPTIDDPDLRNEYEEKARYLRMELDLRELQKIIEHYKTTQKDIPQNFKKLLSQGFIPNIPIDPFGQNYFIDPEGHVMGSKPRLNIHEKKSHE